MQVSGRSLASLPAATPVTPVASLWSAVPATSPTSCDQYQAAVSAAAPLPPTRDPVSTSVFHPDARWAQAIVAQDYAGLGVGFYPPVVLDRTSYVDDGDHVIHLARMKFSPAFRRVGQAAMVDTSFLHLLRHESSHAFFNLTWHPGLAPAFAAAFGPHDAPYDIGFIDQALCGLRRRERPEFVSDYAQEHPLEDFAETMAIYLRLRGDRMAIEQYLQAKGNSPILRRKFDYVAWLVAMNRRQFP